ncbi:YjhG/YagF family D-xylonate dehydratase [Fontisphaera persica]|uniref:YjhG/YagF family D-xylonate dehydratase n=1 Tax=Fontisphaera persica TaxID=2974023 RepID=UPI0024BFCB88|nr:YjhG/YagF family D-xylonate dehydratase [Fontisphaera persica]WCJ60161.1 YjhG/YagF family D-xylonate dehydratase [Fontisphaera persica]
MKTEPLVPSGPQAIYRVATHAAGPAGRLPLTPEDLRTRPSGDLFGMTQNAAMGWNPAELKRSHFLILSTQGGLRDAAGQPVALGYHTGHWEISELVGDAARELQRLGAIPFAGYCSDPCDGRTQGTPGMMDSLPYRNDAAQIFGRLIRSLPTTRGVLGVATCDKGLPAMMMALAGARSLPVVLVPGGVTLPPESGEDAAAIQSIGARFTHGLITLEQAAEWGCRACATPGGGCQFLGTAATAQVVGEALGLTVPHAALAPSGFPVWHDLAVRSARALVRLQKRGLTSASILTEASLHNAMTVFAAFGGSTNLLLHLPAIAHAAGLPRPTVEDWRRILQQTPRLVSVLPNGPVHHPTVRVFLAGGVPEVMLHLRRLGLLQTEALTVLGATVEKVLDAWEKSLRRRKFRRLLQELDGVAPEEVILPPEQAAERGLAGTLLFPRGNLMPEGAVIKSTAVDPKLLDAQGIYHHEAPVKVFVSEAAAMEAIRQRRIVAGDIMVIAGIGPMGTGMEETYQVTSALKYLPYGGKVALLTDGRFSGVSTGVCIGHIGPEALAGGPIGKLRDGDVVRIHLDMRRLEGTVDMVGEKGRAVSPAHGTSILQRRKMRADLAPHPRLPAATRLWAALQSASGGAWGGAVFDVETICEKLAAATRK